MKDLWLIQMFVWFSGRGCFKWGVTDQVEAVGVQRLRFIWFPGRHGNVPALKFCCHLCWTEEDCRIGTATVDQLHQTLLIMQPARRDGWRLYTSQVFRWTGIRLLLGALVLLAVSSVFGQSRSSTGLLPSAVISQLQNQTHLWKWTARWVKQVK